MPTVQKQEDSQQSLEHVTPAFDWGNCFKRLYEALKVASDLKHDRLNLSKKGIVDEEVPVIVDFLNAHPHIKVLDVSGNDIRAAGAVALAGNGTITTLNVASNRIGDLGAEALAGNSTITILNVSVNNIRAAGAVALAGNGTITTLNVASNRIGDSGAAALAENSTITILDVSSNDIGAAGAVALASNGTITTLDVSYNLISNTGAAALAGNSTITTLGVCSNDIGAAGAAALAENSTITILNVSCNDIGAAGAVALASNGTITTLDVSCNNISDEGAKDLASNRIITTLNVEVNRIGDEGAKALARNITLCTLNVKANVGITEIGVRALIQWQEYRMGLFKKQKMEFLMGLKFCLEASPMDVFFKDPLFDRNILRGIFGCISFECELKHSFSFEMLERIKKTQQEPEVEESKVTQEEFDARNANGFVSAYVPSSGAELLSQIDVTKTDEEMLRTAIEASTLQFATEKSLRRFENSSHVVPDDMQSAPVVIWTGSASLSSSASMLMPNVLVASAVSVAPTVPPSPVAPQAPQVQETREQKREKMNAALKKRGL